MGNSWYFMVEEDEDEEDALQGMQGTFFVLKQNIILKIEGLGSFRQ